MDGQTDGQIRDLLIAYAALDYTANKTEEQFFSCFHWASSQFDVSIKYLFRKWKPQTCTCV